jgi:hypothetical protein
MISRARTSSGDTCSPRADPALWVGRIPTHLLIEAGHVESVQENVPLGGRNGVRPGVMSGGLDRDSGLVSEVFRWEAWT